MSPGNSASQQRRPLWGLLAAALLVTAAWGWLNYAHPIAFWNYHWDYHILTLGHALHLDAAAEPGRPLAPGYFQVMHPGLPLQAVSWLDYRLTHLGDGLGALDRARSTLADPHLFWRASQISSLALTLLGLALLGGASRGQTALSFVACAFAVFLWPPAWEFAAGYLGNESFALPLAILFFISLRWSFDAGRRAPWALVAGALAGIAYLNKLNYIAWFAGGLFGWLVCWAVARSRRTQVFGRLALFVVGFGAGIAALGLPLLGANGFQWMLRLHLDVLTHSGHYGGGDAGVVSGSAVRTALRQVMQCDPWFLVVGAGLFALAATLLSYALRRDGRSALSEAPYLAALAGAFGLGVAAALKHFDYHYLVPPAAVLPLLCLWLGARLGSRAQNALAVVLLAAVAASFAVRVAAVKDYYLAAREYRADDAKIRALPIGPDEFRLWAYRIALAPLMAQFTVDTATDMDADSFASGPLRDVLRELRPQDAEVVQANGQVLGADAPSLKPLSWRYAIFDRQYCPGLDQAPSDVRAEAGAVTLLKRVLIIERRPEILAQLREKRRYAWGEAIAFGSQGNASKWQGSGWGGPGATSDWTDGRAAFLNLTPDSIPASDVELSAQAASFTWPAGSPSQRVEISANGAALGVWTVLPAGAEYKTVIPQRLLAAGQPVSIRFGLPDARSPLSLHLSSDPRRLGISISALRLTPLTAADGAVEIGAFEGTFDREASGPDWWRWASSAAVVHLHGEGRARSAEPIPMHVQFGLVVRTKEPVIIEMVAQSGQVLQTRSSAPGNELSWYDLTEPDAAKLGDDWTIRFTAKGEPTALAPGDPRKAAFMIRDFTVFAGKANPAN